MKKLDSWARSLRRWSVCGHRESGIYATPRTKPSLVFILTSGKAAQVLQIQSQAGPRHALLRSASASFLVLFSALVVLFLGGRFSACFCLFVCLLFSLWPLSFSLPSCPVCFNLRFFLWILLYWLNPFCQTCVSLSCSGRSPARRLCSPLDGFLFRLWCLCWWRELSRARGNSRFCAVGATMIFLLTQAQGWSLVNRQSPDSQGSACWCEPVTPRPLICLWTSCVILSRSDSSQWRSLSKHSVPVSGINLSGVLLSHHYETSPVSKSLTFWTII